MGKAARTHGGSVAASPSRAHASSVFLFLINTF